jgi:hypothetical protein
MKIVLATLGVLAVVTLAAVAPDIKRYIRIRSM